MPETELPSPYIDVPAAAKYLNRSPSTIRRMCREGKLRYIQHTGQRGVYQFKRAWLDEYMESRTFEPDAFERKRIKAIEKRKRRAAYEAAEPSAFIKNVLKLRKNAAG